ncbi:FapA family protein [Helicobacter cappadocius]|uniref:FapA family protein n=1 Tax=Helicobacter cappadocius TaxID=3063998 RepID=A0AA90PTM9_9HELI|nr:MULTISPECIES: FapA family protein [unclassified Helicobacter]MDO7253397.1 FapA family protein [Helicobacter sp. faydin-H75]MDP2539339.1 FapA family protein [Helicobacter sp. faydin-H76]
MDALNFVPQVIKNCENINDQLQQFSTSSKIAIEKIWFDVLNINTFIKINEKDEPHMITGNELAQFEKDNFYIKEDFFVHQTYDIRIRPKTKDYGINIEITPNADKVYALFDESFVMIDDERFFEEIFGVIDSLMAQNKIIFRQQFQQRENLKTKLKESKVECLFEKILLKTAPDLIPYKPAEFHFTIKEEWEKEKSKIAPENAFFGVGVDGVIAEYIKPIEGKNGRNLKGVFVKMDTKKIDQIPPITFSKTYVRKEETADKWLFKSLISGYVKILNNFITFNTKYEFDSMKLINAPIFLGGLDSGITLTITSDDDLNDAVGANMIIEATTIDVVGSIGENVELRAQTISIKGQTHQSSIVNATEAKIITHKGKFYGENITVKNLDCGFIQANDCSIETSSGGTIYSKKISIKKLKSNNKINFSSECNLKEIQGGNNEFVISSSSHIPTQETIEFINKKISLLKTKMRSMAKEYQFLISKAKKNKPIIDKIKAADKSVQKVMLNDEDIKKAYQEFSIHVKQLKVLKKELLNLQEKIKQLVYNLMQIEDETLRAKINTNSEWKQENEIIYQRRYPKATDQLLTLKDGENVDIYIDSKTKKITKKIS